MYILYWIKNASFFRQILTITSVSSFLSLLSAIGTILLVRSLTLSDYGRYSIILAYIQFAGPLGTLGQSKLLRTIYSIQGGIGQNWYADMSMGLLINFPVYILSLVILPFIGIDSPFLIFLAGVLMISFGILHYITGILDSNKNFINGSILIRLPFVLMNIPALIMLLSHKYAIIQLLIFLLVFEIIAIIIGISIIFKTPKVDIKRQIKPSRLKAISYSIQLFLHLLPNQGMIILSARLFDAHTVGIYSALWTLFRPFWILHDSTTRISSVEFAHKDKKQVGGIFHRYNLIFLIIGICSLVLYPIITDLVYGNKFAGFHSLLYWMILVNTLLLFDSLPNAYLSMRLFAIRIFGFTSCLIIGGFAGVGISIFSYENLGLSAIVFGTLTIILSRVLTVYYFSIRDIKNQ
ncbi:MAG TPA: hypothetical protein VI583_07285 [Cyclobacteriaceae bacterium]|nr:hypothetical protein [Cyclobacteriaceae bacterium]